MTYITKEEFEKVDKQYGLVVLEDGETWSGSLDGSLVVYLTGEGWEEVNDGMKPRNLDQDQIAMFFDVQQLIDFWNDNNDKEKLK